METYRVSFIGHRRIEDHKEIEKRLKIIIRKLLDTKKFITFQIGRNGEFDTFVASCIKHLQKEYSSHNSSISLILPYKVADMDDYEKYYDSVIIPPEVSKAHFKGAIVARNKWLVDNTELLISYIKRSNGGAYTTYKYAKQQNIPIINIAEYESE